ncbi:fimbrial protein [Serratia fonticola]|uniref:fimbrial protein n=1 Tax=Serratia fonticola TaxID=47917 RepID=UPI00217925D5|nr:fimbrial protein [Serratia fonticola]CAI1011923.1 putative minor fimbrial subunit StfF [Serratia fonticola]CAI1012871.1 putative minor fimbrial subunit StfF [Serratia fonticola]CAI1614704.1 putative minor fimbrial subunit StfF [Serratia fonticola]CAI1738185.1 putative minor fimbrial subunit StfF [Serratia fonticola]CAI1787746.1 putative minor fimbrial subunit StfF [Serratia fonticola]
MTGKTISLAMLLGMLVQPAKAVQVNFQGGLVEALPCTINNGDPIEVDFGDNLVIRNLDGVRYSKPIPYQIDCSAAGVVRLSFKGAPSSFDYAAIQTNLTGLGIRILLKGGVPFPWQTSTFVNVDVQSPPVLTAVPVADPAQPPSPGAFTARATLLAEYQ